MSRKHVQVWWIVEVRDNHGNYIVESRYLYPTRNRAREAARDIQAGGGTTRVVKSKVTMEELP